MQFPVASSTTPGPHRPASAFGHARKEVCGLDARIGHKAFNPSSPTPVPGMISIGASAMKRRPSPIRSDSFLAMTGQKHLRAFGPHSRQRTAAPRSGPRRWRSESTRAPDLSEPERRFAKQERRLDIRFPVCGERFPAQFMYRRVGGKGASADHQDVRLQRSENLDPAPCPKLRRPQGSSHPEPPWQSCAKPVFRGRQQELSPPR